MSSRSLVLLVIAILCVVGVPGRAAARPPPVPVSEPSELHTMQGSQTFLAEGLFGIDTPGDTGWTEVLARVENTTGKTLDGTVELFVSSYADAGRTAIRAPVHVAVGATAYVRLPFFPGRASGSSDVILRTSDGKELARQSVRMSRERAPFLVLVDGSALGAALRSYAVPTWDVGRNDMSPLLLGTPSVDRMTGDPILPEHAAAYATVSVMLVRSDRLARLQGRELEALRSWVRGGGALAIVLARPEDLRHPNIVSFVGGEAREAPAPLTKWSTLATAVKTNGAFDDAEEAGNSTALPKEPLPGVLSTPLTATQRRHWKTGAQLGPQLEKALVSFTGGALEESDFGATARHGLGEVHLLGFDPSAPALRDDAWVHGRIIEMVARAWDRRAQLVFPTGDSAEAGASVRRLLDPNESFRPGLGIAGLLLLVYSVGAGPVLFRIMRKRQKPGLLLRWTPALSALAFFGIVGIGLMTKGVRSRARQLTLVEAGSGDARGTARRFRGFYGSGSTRLAVRASEPGSLLSAASDDDWLRQEGILRVDPAGVALEDIASAPWQTVVVREDATASLGTGGVSLVRGAGDELEIVNRSGYELRDVIVHVPGRPSHGVYFTRIAPGASARTDAATVKLPGNYVSRIARDRPLGQPEFSSLDRLIPARDVERITEVWDAFTSARAGQYDFFPEDVPVLLAEMGGYPAPAEDSGVRLETSRTLVRIIGSEGGAR